MADWCGVTRTRAKPPAVADEVGGKAAIVRPYNLAVYHEHLWTKKCNSSVTSKYITELCSEYGCKFCHSQLVTECTEQCPPRQCSVPSCHSECPCSRLPASAHSASSCPASMAPQLVLHLLFPTSFLLLSSLPSATPEPLFFRRQQVAVSRDTQDKQIL